jgi:hypothetical protein
MHKIDACVGNNAANHFASYVNVFPCTLLLPHVATWDTVLVDYPLAAQDVASFQQAIWHFIAMHATDEDCHELLDYIRNVAKPCKMDVQTYYVCLQELNHQVEWLPGTDLPLTEDQLHQAFFDGMPTTWKERFENASCSICNITHADLLRFFCMQQKAADCTSKQTLLSNNTKVKLMAHSDHTVTQVYKKMRHYKGEAKADTMF